MHFKREKEKKEEIKELVPEKSGKYLADYYLSDHFIAKEELEYDKGKNVWKGSRTDEYYKANIFAIQF